MRKLTATLLISMGILASGSGIIQVSAADYVFFTDFSTKEVANFDDYNPSFLGSTSGLSLNITWTYNTFYRMNTCLPAAASNVALGISYRVGLSGPFTVTTVELPDMTCQAGDTFYQIVGNLTLNDSFLDAIVADDDSYILFFASLTFRSSTLTAGRVITLTDPEFVFSVNYDFDTTYLFNYFLSDSNYSSNDMSAGIVATGSYIHDFDYVMTTAGNDRYFIINDTLTNFGLNVRKKFAIDYEDEYFRGESIGARYKAMFDGTMAVTISSSSSRFVQARYSYYYLNASNKQQDIQNVPEFEYEYEDCGWNVFDIPCFINNGIAYVVNDAPVVSDAFTLLNAGMKLGGQAFSIIGQFTDNNLFGVLILGGLGITAVRWFLKND